MDLAITKNGLFQAFCRNGNAITLPDGTTVLGPLTDLPHAAGEYTVCAVTTEGPLPGADEIGGVAPPEIEGDVVVIRRTVTPMGAEQLAARAAAEAEARRLFIAARLTDIDAASARPLRAIATNAATPADHDRLTALEAEATSLRAELATLSSPESTPTGA